MEKSILKTTLVFFAFLGFMVSCTMEDGPGEGIIIPTTYDGSEYTLPTPFFFPQTQVGLDGPFTQAEVELGRHLFYEKRLSIDNSLSCGGCHRQEAAFADEGFKFSTNVAGLTKRNTPSLANLGYMNKIFWDGRSETVQDATLDAILEEQHIIWPEAIDKLSQDQLYRELFAKAYPNGAITQDNILSAISVFMRTLVSHNSKFDRFLEGDYTMTPEEFRGFELFRSEQGDCFHCHFTTALLTDNIFHNNGLDSAVSIADFTDIGLGEVTGDLNDYGKFKTPTLRNLSYTAPYMHDGRFNTLEEVIDFYADGLRSSPTIDPLMKNLGTKGNQLNASEKADLLAFLLMFDDDEFISNPEFSDPF